MQRVYPFPSQLVARSDLIVTPTWVSQERANIARAVLIKHLVGLGLRRTTDVRATDAITSVAVKPIGRAVGYGLVLTCKRGADVDAAVNEAQRCLIKNDMGDVKVVGDFPPVRRPMELAHWARVPARFVLAA